MTQLLLLYTIVIFFFGGIPFIGLVRGHVRLKSERAMLAMAIFLIGALVGVGFTQYTLPRGWACGPLAKGDWQVHCP